ncbi:MAG: hypothetical protein Q9204_005355 [Flavoplaca sp. TL-2023a]
MLGPGHRKQVHYACQGRKRSDELEKKAINFRRVVERFMEGPAVKLYRRMANMHICAGTKSEADFTNFTNFDNLRTFAAEKPKKGKRPNAAREKAMLESLKRSIEQDKRKLDAKLAAKVMCSFLSFLFRFVLSGSNGGGGGG